MNNVREVREDIQRQMNVKKFKRSLTKEEGFLIMDLLLMVPNLHRIVDASAFDIRSSLISSKVISIVVPHTFY